MRVLFLTHRLPYAPDRGDRIRSYYILKALRGIARVDLVSLVHDDQEASQAGTVQPLAESVHVARVPRVRGLARAAWRLAGSTPLTHVILSSPALRPALDALVARTPPDVVLAYCSGMARIALEPPLDRFPLVIELVDVDSLKWSALGATAPFPLSWVYRREARVLRDFERRAVRAAVATTVVNERERSALMSLDPGAPVFSVSSGIDCARWKPTSPPPPSKDVVFCGVMNYRPNEDAAVWLAREVWPLVRRRVPHARLRLIGSHPTSRVRQLASADVEVTGHVPDVRPHLWSAAVAAAPLFVARGIQNKVLEAVAAGLPTVVTPAVAEGLPACVRAACAVATDPTDFADAVVRYVNVTPEERRRIAGTADLTRLSWEERLQPLISLLESAAQSKGKSAARESIF